MGPVLQAFQVDNRDKLDDAIDQFVVKLAEGVKESTYRTQWQNLNLRSRPLQRRSAIHAGRQGPLRALGGRIVLTAPRAAKPLCHLAGDAQCFEGTQFSQHSSRRSGAGNGDAGGRRLSPMAKSRTFPALPTDSGNCATIVRAARSLGARVIPNSLVCSKNPTIKHTESCGSRLELGPDTASEPIVNRWAQILSHPRSTKRWT